MNLSPAQRMGALVVGDVAGMGVDTLLGYVVALAKLTEIRVVAEFPPLETRRCRLSIRCASCWT